MQLEWASGSEFHPELYPATAHALAGGSYYASLTEGDNNERAFLARMGAVFPLAAVTATRTVVGGCSSYWTTRIPPSG